MPLKNCNAVPMQTNVVHAKLKKSEMLLHVAGLAEKLQHTLVSAKHNSGAGYNAEHVGHETTVERGHALLFPDELETLRQACVLETTVLLRGLSQKVDPE